MKNLARQKGTTFIGWVVIIALILFFVYVGMKLMPIYLDNYSIKKVMVSLEKDPGFSFQRYTPLTKNKFKKTLYKRFTVNALNRDLLDKLTLAPQAGGAEVSLDYEVREHLFANIDIVLTFNNSVVVEKT